MLPKVDMLEVTRLTRAGKLAEAMALLQGQPAKTGPAKGEIELTEAEWRDVGSSPGTPRAPAQDDELSRVATRARRGLADTLQSLMTRAKAGLGDGPLGKSRPPLVIPPGARFDERDFTNAAGSRSYKVYVPSGRTGQGLPLVVMLHGCTQDPDDFAAGTRMNDLAEEFGFLVTYPRQTKAANMQKCWNWFSPGDQRRDSGEPSIIAGIAEQVCAEFAADCSRIYVAGLSAGGATAAIMAQTYPELFAAAGIHSGLASGAAHDLPSALAAMKKGSAVPGARAISRPIIVFHGDADPVVHPRNGDQVAAQARPAGATRTVTEGKAPDGMAYSRAIETDAGGRPMLEQWVLHGAGHAWSGGSPTGTYVDPRGPDASREMIRFFLSHVHSGA